MVGKSVYRNESFGPPLQTITLRAPPATPPLIFFFFSILLPLWMLTASKPNQVAQGVVGCMSPDTISSLSRAELSSHGPHGGTWEASDSEVSSHGYRSSWMSNSRMDGLLMP
jgi:hypothetical protein